MTVTPEELLDHIGMMASAIHDAKVTKGSGFSISLDIPDDGDGEPVKYRVVVEDPDAPQPPPDAGGEAFSAMEARDDPDALAYREQFNLLQGRTGTYCGHDPYMGGPRCAVLGCRNYSGNHPYQVKH